MGLARVKGREQVPGWGWGAKIDNGIAEVGERLALAVGGDGVEAAFLGDG